jgi:hypothetical protein
MPAPWHPRHAAFGATRKSFQRNPAGASLLQEAWLRLGNHSRDNLLERADDIGLAEAVRADLVHEPVPAVRGPTTTKHLFARPKHSTAAVYCLLLPVFTMPRPSARHNRAASSGYDSSRASAASTVR